MATLTFNGTRPELARMLRRAVAIASGLQPDVGNAGRKVAIRVGLAALAEVRTDFVTKARGGTGRDGIKWAPLKRETIAQRRITPGEWRAAGLHGTPTQHNYQRGLLTPEQNRRWRAIFASRLAKLRMMGEPNAEAIAARIAWAVLKREGAQTKLATFGNRVVEIGRDTGRMMNSLSPGVNGTVDADTFLQALPGKVIVGSNVLYFPRFNARRPCWPTDGSIPDAWWPAIKEAAEFGIQEIISRLIGEGPS